MVTAAVTFTVIFMALHITKNSALTNSPPLSFKNFLGAPKIWIQLLNIAMMITLDSLDGTKVDADNLVAWWRRWRRISLYKTLDPLENFLERLLPLANL